MQATNVVAFPNKINFDVQSHISHGVGSLCLIAALLKINFWPSTGPRLDSAHLRLDLIVHCNLEGRLDGLLLANF